MAFMYYAPRDPATIQRIAAAKRTLAGAPLYLSVCIDHGDSDPAHDPNHGTMGAITPVCHKNTTDGVTIRAELDELRAAGVRVLHYVHSRQLYRDGKPAPCCKCCDSLGNVTRRIDSELTAFPNDGIFTDNVVANASHAEFYRAVQRETQSGGMAHTWMNGNCHANKCRGFDPEFTDLADVVTVWEGYVSDFTEGALELPNLTPAQQKKLSVMVYNGTNCTSPTDCQRPNSWRSIIDRARGWGIHNFWVIGAMHAEGPLPDYFEDLVAYVAGLNTAAAAAAASATAAGAAAMPRGSLTCGQSSPSLLISPSSSPENPLRERSLQFSVSAGVDDNGRTQVYLIQTINASDPNTQLSVWICANAGGTSPNTTEIVAPLVDTVDNGPFPSLDLVGAVNVQVAAYTARDGVCLGVSPPQTVHYDLRYTTLTHSLDVTPQDHNWVRFTASPVDAILGAQTQSWTFSLFNPTETTWTPDTLYKQNHSGEYNYQFGAPGVYFFGLVYSSNGFDLHATRAAPSVYDGLFAQPAPLVLRDGKPSFQPIAVVVPFANGSVPSIPSVPKFVGRVVQLSAVPEDVTLCMPHRQLTILAGPPGAGVVFLPLCRPTTHVSATQHLGIKLPAGVTVLPAPTGSVGLVVQNISRLSDGTWVIAGEASTPTLSTVIAVVFKAEASLVGTTVDAQLATYAGAGPPSSTSLAWQTVELIVVAWPTISRIPQHLITAITDAPVSKLANLFVLDNGASLLDVYSRLGMSVFPTGGANQIDPRTGPGAPATKHGRFYFPVNRTGPEWPVGLKYGIEYGTFSSGFNGPGFYCLTHAPKGGGGVGCPVNASALPSGLSPQQRASELTQWTNAVAFLNTTGYSDMAYSGFLLNESFVNLELVTSIIRPDAVFSDAEKFPPYDVFVSTIGHSANANDHHRPGETDCTLAARIAAEFLQEWVAATGDAVLYFYGDTPEGGHGAHGPWLAGALAQYGEQIVPQFGLYNAQASYPIDVFAKWIRMNKVAHETRGLHGMVPWVTTGFDGPTTAPQTLVQAVHLFAGGCTGFNIFCTAADGDCDSWGNMLAFTRAVQLVEPYEELVAFGSVAFSAVLTNGSNSNIFAVSAVEFHGQYLVALSAKDSAAPMHVVVNVSSSAAGFRVHDLLSGTTTSLPAANMAIFDVYELRAEGVALVVLDTTGCYRN